MKKIIAGLIVAASIIAAPTSGQTGGVEVQAETACVKPFEHNRYARYVLGFSHTGGNFKASNPTKRQLNKLGSLRACVKGNGTPAYGKMRHYWEVRRDKWAFHRHIDQITVYGKWAIPAYIVYRESRYNRCAKNPSSTAAGYYQFLDSTWAAYGGTGGTAQCAPSSEQHEVAARAWDGGNGSSHWALTA